jgi:ribosome biogenesis ATPase
MTLSSPPPPSSLHDGFVVRPPPLPPTVVGSQSIQIHAGTVTSGIAAAGGAAGADAADRKLLHLVRKVLASSSSSSSTAANGAAGGQSNNSKKMNADTIVQTLRQQHREYQRKDAAVLRRQVESALQKIAASSSSSAASPGVALLEDGKNKRKQRPVPKRKSSAATIQEETNEDGGNNNIDRSEENNNDYDKDDAEYDQAAAQHDAVRQELLHTSSSSDGGGLLNASLRTRYRQIQQSRDAQVAAEAAAAVLMAAPQEQADQADSQTQAEQQHSSHASGSQKSDNNGDNDDDEEDADDGGADASPPTPTTAAAEASSTAAAATGAEGKGKKRKKPSKSSGSAGAAARRRMSSSAGASSGSMLASGDGASSNTDFMTPVDPSPTERYSDLGGLHDVIQEIRQLVEYPLLRPELYRHLGVVPPRGVLLRGPPGVGKTHLANAVAGELSKDNNGGGVAYFRVSAPELVSSMSGDSEGRIRALFQAASDMAPSLIFMDELDAIAPKRSDNAGGGRGMEKRMVAQLLTCMDMVAPVNNRNQAAVLILGATNRPDALDPALRRAGRFDKEILLSVPDEAARMGILRTMTQGMRLMTTPTTSATPETSIITTVSATTTLALSASSSDPVGFDFKILARKTPGFVGADLQSLTKEAAVVAINRIFRDVLDGDSQNDTTATITAIQDKAAAVDTSSTTLALVKTTTTRAPIIPLTAEQMDPLYVTMHDFLTAIPLVQPSSKREGFATVPDVSWDDIGALKAIREELTISVLEPIRHPEKFQMLGLPIPAGCMLYGPPGCGKTLLAKAIAHESGANFISIKGPELLDKYVGESERAVRLVFERARSSCPCIVFFDELDSLVPRRGGSGGDSGGGGVSERVVNQLLTEMDGVTGRKSVFCIAATNRPELIDPAMMRPGRLDKLLYVPLPTPEDRVSILRAQAKNMKLHGDVDLDAIGTSPRANGYSGADCTALLREAGLAVLKEDAVAMPPMTAESLCIRARHFELAFANVSPSVSKKDQARYDRIRHRMARARSRSVDETAAEAAADDDMVIARQSDAPPMKNEVADGDAATTTKMVHFPAGSSAET